jgi:hypothetical protein
VEWANFLLTFSDSQARDRAEPPPILFGPGRKLAHPHPCDALRTLAGNHILEVPQSSLGHARLAFCLVSTPFPTSRTRAAHRARN